MRYLIFVVGMGLGFVLVKYSKWMVEHSGIRWPKLENMLGPGSMHTIWKLTGVIIIILSFFVLFGGLAGFGL